VKRTKLPALTSPWKIGFFVSLMLVSVSVGVAYFFIDKFGVSWNWLDKNEWMAVVRGEGFLYELLPVIALVSVTAMFSYLVIAGAVRKYKRFLDSGLDYKNLLMSLKEIDDLEDKSKIEKIRNHPELKRLLLGVSERLTDEREALAEREAETEKMVDEAVMARHEELTQGFAAQCESLATAIREGEEDLVSPQTGVSNSSLHSLSEAIQNRLESLPRHDAVETGPVEIGEESGFIKNKLEEITAELRDNSGGAKEIEELLKSMTGDDAPDTDHRRLEAARGEIRGVLDTLKSLEVLSRSLGVLSEETKGIAISTALHAGSGEGTQDDLIRLAEDIKEIAIRFKESTERFSEVSTGMRSSIGSLEAVVGNEIQSAAPGTEPGHSYVSLSNKVSLWVERVMVLTEKVSGFQASLEAPAEPAPVSDTDESFELKDTPAVTTDDGFEKTKSEAKFSDRADEFGFEMLDRGKSLFDESTDESAPAKPDIPKDTGIFEEMSAESVDSQDVTDEADITDKKEEIPETPSKTPDLSGFETFARQTPPRFDTGAPKEGSPAEPERFKVDEDRFGSQEDRLEPVEDTLKPDTDLKIRDDDVVETAPEKLQTKEQDNVIDLYALGAVDYDPAVHG
jgi:hypothetical protein